MLHLHYAVKSFAVHEFRCFTWKSNWNEPQLKLRPAFLTVPCVCVCVCVCVEFKRRSFGNKVQLCLEYSEIMFITLVRRNIPTRDNGVTLLRFLDHTQLHTHTHTHTHPPGRTPLNKGSPISRGLLPAQQTKHKNIPPTVGFAPAIQAIKQPHI